MQCSTSSGQDAPAEGGSGIRGPDQRGAELSLQHGPAGLGSRGRVGRLKLQGPRAAEVHRRRRLGYGGVVHLAGPQGQVVPSVGNVVNVQVHCRPAKVPNELHRPLARLAAAKLCMAQVDADAQPAGLVVHLHAPRRQVQELPAKDVLHGQQDPILAGGRCLFAHPRYVHGTATSCNADVFAYAAAQVAKAVEVTKELGGAGYVFWGGREGYKSLLNTDLPRELDRLGRFLHMAVEYKQQMGFDGQLYIEPKPKEPTKHQYDFDAAACYGFLHRYGLLEHFKLNIEANHATLAGHSFHHELEFAAAAGLLGSVDANRGDTLLGWDTDQFPTYLYDTAFAMLTILKAGGFTTGGLNFDAHVARESFEPVDLFHAHIGGMDAFARGLKAAAAIRADGVLEQFLKQRYASWDSGIGAEIESGKVGFKELSRYMLEKGEISPNASGRVEMLENILNEYI